MSEFLPKWRKRWSFAICRRHLGENEFEMQKCLDILTNWCMWWRLNVSCAFFFIKKIMHFRKRNISETKFKFRVGNDEIRYVNHYRYLGGNISREDAWTSIKQQRLWMNPEGEHYGQRFTKFMTIKILKSKPFKRYFILV